MTFKTAEEHLQTALQYLIAAMIDLTKALKVSANDTRSKLDTIANQIRSIR